MSLNIATPTYELELPSNKKKIKYRPFLVKEEKVLLVAMEDGSDKAIIGALGDIVKACTFGTVDIQKCPTVDVEYLFLMLRNKSMGEGLELDATCTNCEKKNRIQCSFDKVKIEGTDTNKNIDLSSDLKVVMKYPTLDMAAMDEGKNDIDKTIEIIAKSIEFIEYRGKLHDTSELKLTEVINFVENLTQVQVNKIDEFLESIPKTVFEDKFTCKYCSHENHVRLEGISNFFV